MATRDDEMTLLFDDRNIPWQSLGADQPLLEGIYAYVFDVDETSRTADVLFKFPANEKIVLHRHICAYSTFVLQGELRFYKPDGELKEVRPVGSYVLGEANGKPHREGGGAQDVVVLFSHRNIPEDGAVSDLLEDDLSVARTLRLADFKRLFEAQ